MNKSEERSKPQQKRSQKRYEEVLTTAEYILTSDSSSSLTIQDIAKVSGMKRPSIYKFFPSNESILEALSEKHCNLLINLIKRNLDSLNHYNIFEYFKIIVDVVSIFINQNKEISRVLFTKTAEDKLVFMIGNLLVKLISGSKVSNQKIKVTTRVLISSLYDGYLEENSISPSCNKETKRICLSYLANK